MRAPVSRNVFIADTTLTYLYRRKNVEIEKRGASGLNLGCNLGEGEHLEGIGWGASREKGRFGHGGVGCVWTKGERRDGGVDGGWR